MKNPLKINTIFWKIFLSYWLVMVLIILATTMTVGLLVDRDHSKFRQQLADSVQASVAINLYDAGGAEAFKNWLHEHGHRHGRKTFLINDKNDDVLGRPIPPRLLASIMRGEQPETADRQHRWNVQKVVSRSGQEYSFAHLTFKGKHNFRPRFLPMGVPRPFKWLTLGLALLVTGLISFWLARNITLPIKRLQLAAQQIRQGDFTTRVDTNVSKRKDELGDLSRDFDRMAQQIEQLLTSQQRTLRDISHELRSPLARLQVALELARKATNSSAQSEHDRIEKEANRLDELIGQVMSLVRLETQSEKVLKEKLELFPLLQSAVEDADFEAESQQKSVSLSGDQRVFVVANETLILSALENIIRNAVRYTSLGTTVEVSMKTESRETGKVVISIRDYGPGVSEQALEHLFEPFCREADARDRNTGGYGLGLAIAERAIKAHGGRIIAHNLSDGLEVTIDLPLDSLA